jgi:PAS domain S-box-containing protein
VAPAYALVLAVHVFGLVSAARIWTHDAIGGLLVAAASAATVVIAIWGMRIDLAGAHQPYLGAIGFLAWVVLLAVHVAREYRSQSARLAAAENRFRAIFDQTFQFIGLLALDGTVLEANQAALSFAGVTRTDVAGQRLWDTVWWAHSPDLQERLRQASRTAAAGETVRFEATQQGANGRLHDVDFSLKAARNDRGEVFLMIAEGRDITAQNQAQAALEQSRERLQRLAAGLLVAREEERATIARDIHDDLGQALTALKMDVKWIARRVGDAVSGDAQAQAVEEKTQEMSALIDETIATVRRIGTELRPGVLDDLGLTAAVEWQVEEFERRSGIRCTLDVVDTSALDRDVATAAFRVLQEALTNVARHSGASRVVVRLAVGGSTLLLEVRDDGTGITPEKTANAQSIGLAGMRERAQLVGGSLTVSGSPGAGTCVRAEIPIAAAVAV